MWQVRFNYQKQLLGSLMMLENSAKPSNASGHFEEENMNLASLG